MAAPLTAAIIQARMSSSRLPGKVMMEICGRPMIFHIVDRVGHSRTVNQTIIATSDHPSDDIIANFCRKENIPCHRGSLNDVLGRYFNAAKAVNADTVIRITADCPLIDPEVIDKVVDTFNHSYCDYASNVVRRTYPDGLDTEVFSFATLQRAHQNALTEFEREHVTTHIRRHTNQFTQAHILQEDNLEEMRWTVDLPEDFENISKIYHHLYKPGNFFLMKDVLELFKSHPELDKRT